MNKYKTTLRKRKKNQAIKTSTNDCKGRTKTIDEDHQKNMKQQRLPQGSGEN